VPRFAKLGSQHHTTRGWGEIVKNVHMVKCPNKLDTEA